MKYSHSRALRTARSAKGISCAPIPCPTRMETVCPSPNMGIMAREFRENATPDAFSTS